MASALRTLETVRVWPHFPLTRPGYGWRLETDFAFES